MFFLHAILLGLFLGMIIAAPVGPIGLLCIRRTLQYGVATGLVTGFGAALADTFFGSMAVLGVSTVLSFLQSYAVIIRLVGGVVLMLIGVIEYRAKVKEFRDVSDNHSLFHAFTTGAFFTLMNPVTLFTFIAVFAGIGIGDDESGVTMAFIILGIFIGASLWWVLLGWGVFALKKKISLATVVRINRIAALLLIVFGAYAIASGIDHGLGYHHIF